MSGPINRILDLGGRVVSNGDHYAIMPSVKYYDCEVHMKRILGEVVRWHTSGRIWYVKVPKIGKPNT